MRELPAPRESSAAVHRPSYLAAAIASGFVFALYLVTLSPSTAMWDASEYITAAYALGLPHPPGNPFFMLVGRLFAILPIAHGVAARVNILAALSSAVSAGMWFLITERVLSYWLRARWQRIVGASTAILVAATVFTVWNQSVVNEKVYTVSLAFFAVVSWLTVLWCDDPEGPTADRILILIAFLIGLGYTNHPAGFLVAPAVGVAVLARRWQTVLRWPMLLGAGGAMLLGLSTFAVEPLRSAHFPAINEGEPTGCMTEFHWSCTFSTTTYERLRENINRSQYAKPALDNRQAPFPAQVGMWWHYFRWQWLRDPYDNHRVAQRLLAALFLFLGLLGGWTHWRRDQMSFWFFGPLIFTVTVVLIFYMNFKYGYSQSLDLGNTVPREVRDRDYFYLWSFSAWSVWVGLGLVTLWEQGAELVTPAGGAKRRADGDVPSLPRSSWLIASPVLAIALVPLIGNWHAAPRNRDTFTRDWAVDVLNSVEPYGIIVTNGDNDTFPLWYAQEVEGVRQDVTVAVTSLLNTDWYVRQIVRRPPRPYDAAGGPTIYRDHAWPVPPAPPLALTLAEADAVPPYMELPQARVFEKDSIHATLKPGGYSRDQMLVLRMIHDAFPQRGLFFTSAGYAQALGLGPYVVQMGIVSKLLTSPPPKSPRYVNLQGFGTLDIDRSVALWDSVYIAPRTIVALDRWVDRASTDIPLRYVVTGAVLGDALAQSGRPDQGKTVTELAQRIANAARLNEILGLPKRVE